MEDQILHKKAAESKMIEPSYSIVVYSGHALPSEYVPLIFSRWLRSLRFGNALFKKISSKEYFKNYHLFIEKLLAKPDCKVRFAVLSDDRDVVLGFSVTREDVLDYVHVHTDYRRIGVGAKLVPPDITTFSHITAPAIIIWQKKDSKYKELKFNPFA